MEGALALALCFRAVLLLFSLFGGMVLHAILQGTNALTQAFAQFGELLRTEHQQGNKEDYQQVHRLK